MRPHVMEKTSFRGKVRVACPHKWCPEFLFGCPDEMDMVVATHLAREHPRGRGLRWVAIALIPLAITIGAIVALVLLTRH